MCLNIRLKGFPLRLPLRTGLGSLDEKTSQNRQGQGNLDIDMASPKPIQNNTSGLLKELKNASAWLHEEFRHSVLLLRQWLPAK